MKKWHESKTIWLNLIALLLGLIPMIDENILIAFGVLNTQSYLTVLGALTGVLNLLLRMITSTTIQTLGGSNTPPIKDEK